MSKSTCLLALFVAIVACAEAIRIDTAQPETTRRGKYFASTKKNDPRCKNGNGFYPIENDCTKYLKCVNGDSREKKCPADFKFDTIRHCVQPTEHPDCGKPIKSSPLNVDEKCPESYGYFPVKSDCHKYMICHDGVPTVKECPKNYYYRDLNGACMPGDCPDQSEGESVCKRSNQLVADKGNCRRYIKCVNFQTLKKECPPGKAFDPVKYRCTEDYLEKCKNNDILTVGQVE